MTALLALARGIDAVNARIGKAASWLILAAIVISAGNALVRKLFDLSSNAWLELQWVLFAAVFLLCASWTLMDNEHIRIDIVNSHLRKKVRDGIDIFGHLFFLLPFSILLLWTSWPFFMASYSINEQSLNAGGLPQWPAKLLVPVGFFFLTLQGFSELIKRIAIFTGRMEDPHEGEGGSHAALAAEAERLLAVAEEIPPGVLPPGAVPSGATPSAIPPATPPKN